MAAALLLLAAALAVGAAAVILLQSSLSPVASLVSPSAPPGASSSANPPTESGPTLEASVASPTAAPTIAPTAKPTPRPTPASTPNTAPTILAFKAPATASCPSGTSVATVHLTWKIANASGVILGINSPGIYAAYSGTSGSADLPFSCENAHNTYYLTTTGGTGTAAVAKRTVQRAS